MTGSLFIKIASLVTAAALVSCVGLDRSPFVELGVEAPALSSSAFSQAMEGEALGVWRGGNRVETLVNGGEYFPKMLEAVKSAKKTITFETFVAVDGYVTYDLVMAMVERARAGVRVHVIFDGIGSSRMDEAYLEALRSGGVEVELYKPFNIFKPISGNNRDHRKILVVDGELGFTGGAGYADCWNGDARDEGEWRDTMYSLRGPIVADLQHGFSNNWKELRGVELEGEEYFPQLKRLKGVNTVEALVTLGAPYERGDTLGAANLLAIDAAKKSILIEHAYFLPNKQLKKAIIRACERGVKVEVIVPNEHIDTAVVREVSKTHWPELMAAGVQIYEFQPSMMHGKLMVVDDELSVIGSGNFDDRSFFINDELNVLVRGKRFAREQREMFEFDRSRSKRMTRKDARVRLREIPRRAVGKLLEPQL